MSITPNAPRSWLVSSVVFGVAFVGLGLLVSSGTNAVDARVAASIAPLRSTELAPLLRVLDGLGQAFVWDLLVLAAALALLILGVRRAAALLVLALGSELPVAIAKAAFDRPRPLPPITELLAGVEEGSYPSGHVVRVAVTACVVALAVANRRARVTALALGSALTLAMALARVSSLEHWATDVLGAVALVVAYVSLLMAVLARQDHANAQDWQSASMR